MDCLDWINFGISVGKIGHVEAFFVNTHAQDSIFSQINILIVEHLLIRVRRNINPTSVDGVRKQCTRKGTADSNAGLSYFVVS